MECYSVQSQQDAAVKRVLGQARIRLTPALLNSGSLDQGDDNSLNGENLVSATRRRKPLKATTHPFRSDGDATAIGDGSVDDGTVSSNQDSTLTTNDDGTAAQAGNVGQGTGKTVRLNGAVNAAAKITGSRFQSQFDGQQGAASGDAAVKSGSANSVQSSRVNTVPGGASVQTSSAGHASGTGVKLSGAASSSGSGNGQTQQQQSFFNTGNGNDNDNNFNFAFPLMGPQPGFSRVRWGQNGGPGGPGAFGGGFMIRPNIFFGRG